MDSLLLVCLAVLGALCLLNLLATAALFRELAVLILGTARGADMTGIPPGKRLPEQSFASLGGGTWSTDVFRGSNGGILAFASPDCADCKAMIPLLAYATSANSVRCGLVVLGPEEKATEFARMLRTVSGDCLIAIAANEIGALFDIAAVPYGYAVDERGVVKARGLLTSSTRIEQLVSELVRPIVPIPHGTLLLEHAPTTEVSS